MYRFGRAINMPKLRGQEFDQDNLNEEFADILLQLAILAELHHVDFESAVRTKVEELKNHHDLNV